MAENVVVVRFEVESEAYQALAELKRAALSPDYIVSQIALVKNEQGRITAKESFDTGVETTNDTRRGGLIGSLVGILGGPIGVILGGSIGALTGMAFDSTDAARNVSLIEKVCEEVPEDKTALIALVSEQNLEGFDKRLDKFTVSIARHEAAVVEEEIEEAVKLQRELEKETRQKLRAEKKEAREQKVEERRAKIKADFEELKAKLSRKE